MEVTDAQLASLAGVSTRRIRQLAEQGTLTRVGVNRYNLKDAFSALIEEAAGQGSELNKQRTRLVRAQADRHEMEYLGARKLLAPIEQLKTALDVCYAHVRINMLNIPQRVIAAIIGMTDERAMKAALLDEIKLALNSAAIHKFDIEKMPTPHEDDDYDA